MKIFQTKQQEYKNTEVSSTEVIRINYTLNGRHKTLQSGCFHDFTVVFLLGQYKKNLFILQ